MKNFIILLLPIFLTSCATTMPGSETNTGHKNVSATVETNPTFTNNQIQMYQYSFQNETDNWIEFDGAIMSGSAEVSVLVGDKISAWVDACTLEKNVSDYNTSMVLGAIAATGVVVAGSTNHAQTANAGAIVALGSISALGVQEYQKSKNKAEFQKAFPRTHIFQPFSLPPRKVLQRWVLVENPKGESFELRLKSKTGEEISLKVQSREEEMSSLPKQSKKALAY